MPDEPHSFAYLFERFPSFVQTFVYREAVEMVRQGMNPWLVSLRHPEDSGDVAEKLEVPVFYAPDEKPLRAEVDARRAQRQLPGKAHAAIPKHRNSPDAQRMFEAIWLAPLLAERKIRHVHAHFGGLAARTAWWLRKLFGVRYSFTGHANDIFCETDFPVSNADLVRDATFVVTETDHARRWMEEKYPSAQGKIFRVFNGVGVDDFLPPAPAGVLPRILSVGRYVEKKGFGDLIEACRLLRARRVDFICEIVGGGPLESALQSQIVESDLEGHVKLLGPRPQSEVRRLLAAAQLFVLPCVPEKDGGSDNLPTVIMEAMLAGVPVISTPVAGVPEMIENGVDGLLVPTKDPPALAQAMGNLLSDTATADRFRMKGRVSAEAKFAVEKTTAALKHLLAGRTRIPIPAAARALDPTLPSASILTGFLRFFDK
ncbi:MAG TPA: glycosyltransferase family 4 protein [Chthoniobacter sp.]